MVREIREETGLRVTCGALVGSVERPGLQGAVIDIRDYMATVTGGTLTAGDDAADARWVSPADVAALPLTSGLAETLLAWECSAEVQRPARRGPGLGRVGRRRRATASRASWHASCVSDIQPEAGPTQPAASRTQPEAGPDRPGRPPGPSRRPARPDRGGYQAGRP